MSGPLRPHVPTLVFVDGDGDLVRCSCGKQGYDFHGGNEWFAIHEDAALHREAEALMPSPDPTPGLREADAEKLRVLATWFDRFDDWREDTGKIAPGLTDYREVQEDLRRIAAALDASPAPEPTGLDTARQFIERNARRMDPDKEPVMADEDEVNLYGTAGEFRALRALAASPAPEPTGLDAAWAEAEEGKQRN